MSAWSTISTPSFSALPVLLAPTFSPQISRSVLAETDDAAVAPARSASRWKVGRGIFSPLRGSAIVPVMTTVLPASGASPLTSGGRLRAHVEVHAELAQAPQLRARRVAVEVRAE